MDRPPLWPIVKLGSGPKIQISTSRSRRIAKISPVCIKPKLGENGRHSQLIELTNGTFRTPG